MPRDPYDMSDLDRWPSSWSGTSSDMKTGEQIVDLFRPFLLHLRSKAVSPRTFRRHLDNLWMLGGELIRQSYYDQRIRRSPERVLLEYAEFGEAPLLRGATEREQEGVDATVRAFMRFRRAARSPSAPRGGLQRP